MTGNAVIGCESPFCIVDYREAEAYHVTIVVETFI